MLGFCPAGGESMRACHLIECIIIVHSLTHKMPGIVTTAVDWRRVESWSLRHERGDKAKIRSARPLCTKRPQQSTKKDRPSLRGTTLSAASSAESIGEPFAEDLIAVPFSERRTWWSSPHDGQILQLALPILLANLVTPITASVDTAVVARLGTAQLSGVAVGSIFFSLISSSLAFIPILVAPYVARNHAAKKYDEVSSYVAQIMWLSLGLGIALSTFMFTQADFIINTLNLAGEIRPFATTYLRMAATYFPGFMCFMCCGSVLRGLRDGSSLLRASIASCIINAVLDVVFVFGFGWSIAGAASATVLSVYTSAGMLLHKLFHSGVLRAKDFLKWPDIKTILPLVSEGLRFSLRSILFMSMVALASVSMSKHSPVAHAAFELFKQFTMFMYTITLSLQQTVQTMSASALGAENLGKARGIIRRTIEMSFVSSSVLAATLMVFSTQIARIFTSDPAVILTCASTKKVFLLLVPIGAVVSIVDGALIGASKVPLVSLSQGLGYSLAILALLGFNYAGWLNVTITWCIIRIGMLFSGVITAPFLFSSKSSPYGFALLP